MSRTKQSDPDVLRIERIRRNRNQAKARRRTKALAAILKLRGIEV